jgi:hypothetical protein
MPGACLDGVVVDDEALERGVAVLVGDGLLLDGRLGGRTKRTVLLR